MTDLIQKPKTEVPAIQKTPVTMLLEYPFRPDQIKQLTRGGLKLDYIETAAVIQRLNDAFGHDGWSFDILQETEASDETIVKAKLTVHLGGRDVLKTQFGSHPYSRKKGTDEIISKGDTLKAAASDALKKCASLLGVGLHVYADDGSYKSFDANGEVVDSPVERKPGKGNHNGNEITANRLRTEIYEIGKERGLDKAAVDEIAYEKVGRPMEEWVGMTLLSFKKALADGAFDPKK